MNFDLAFERLIGHEGGYVSAQQAVANNDPGGETKYGISKRSYPSVDIAALTLAQAKKIYAEDFWGVAGCDWVPDSLKYALFDFAVNSGPRTAAKFLQRTVGVTEDGVVGPKTIAAITSMPQAQVAARFFGHRLEFMASLGNWPENGRGWARRIASELKAV